MKAPDLDAVVPDQVTRTSKVAWQDTDSVGEPPESITMCPSMLPYFQPGNADASMPDVETAAREQPTQMPEVAHHEHSRAVLAWRVCNPFRDGRLLVSLRMLALHVGVVFVALATVSLFICFWTRAAVSKHAEHMQNENSACLQTWSARELKSLLLSIDIPMFVCLGSGYGQAMLVLYPGIAVCSHRWPVLLVYVFELLLVFTGSIIVASHPNPFSIWGPKDGIGFAGIWISVQTFVGVITITLAATFGPREVCLWKRWHTGCKACTTWLVSAVSVQGMYYLANTLDAQGVSDAVSVMLMLAAVFLIVTVIKQATRQWRKVPVLATAFMLFWFQTGAYFSLRLFLQYDRRLDELALALWVAAISEIVLRCALVISGKLLYNYCARNGDLPMALRVLDMHVAALVVDIVAEWAAIAVAGSFGAAIDESIFSGLAIRGSASHAAASMILQLCFECFADVVSLVLAYSLLPVSFMGVFHTRGYLLAEASFIPVALIFAFGTMNIRIRITCFT
mmetsp:Transcript_19289/g.37882  ORF Transcript_19289/g.37882 Transcript_19289/m.37882 type:complete len:509 (-) Transcript_19289:238-1764(-)